MSSLYQEVRTIVDEERCIGCGLCVRVCPSRTLRMVDGKAKPTGRTSIQCGHCQAVCPTGAVQVTTLDPRTYEFATFSASSEWSGFGKDDPGVLARLMASRRSCRNFKDAPVSRDMLEDLVKLGIAAPSGTNSQRWTFTLLPTRAAVARHVEDVAGYFNALNKKAEKRWLRLGLRLLGQPELEQYYRSYYRAVARAYRDWQEHGIDRLFHSAPAAILVGCAPGASCPAEDALLATQNMLLGAHAMGLGTCLIGYAVAAMRRDPTIQQRLGVPGEECIYAVIALGWPDERYQHVALRRMPIIRVAGD
ncbi:nitroreductase family protein [Megalodesulfovibrio gigas]|uniref:Putative nitroreductase n=1 Tax=Megalodesulfovibrio gigas (strain ATCC 19364 / DSM 1382 / NCIMB 9332 / VKM B-1759) TaxID=1121448 RepID=T2G9P0_MEGG1|nr:nitroreductase family protein [Megalodesulfovibrio gigas]AGW13310.1 putative nitroreductase [Megalodesulfovibrio gigas DSM 1382 = ATCC 19364]